MSGYTGIHIPDPDPSDPLWEQNRQRRYKITSDPNYRKLISSLPDYTARIVKLVCYYGVQPNVFNMALDAPAEEVERYKILRMIRGVTLIDTLVFWDELTAVVLGEIEIALNTGVLP